MTIDSLQRPEARVPRPVLDALVRTFDPIRVILFGSHARGAAGPDSDLDLMVVVDDALPAERRTVRAAFEAVAGTGVAVDVVPVRVGTFDYKRDVVNSLPWFAATEGVVVYERGEQRKGT